MMRMKIMANKGWKESIDTARKYLKELQDDEVKLADEHQDIKRKLNSVYDEMESVELFISEELIKDERQKKKKSVQFEDV
jgi:hypothetical protein